MVSARGATGNIVWNHTIRLHVMTVNIHVSHMALKCRCRGSLPAHRSRCHGQISRATLSAQPRKLTVSLVCWSSSIVVCNKKVLPCQRRCHQQQQFCGSGTLCFADHQQVLLPWLTENSRQRLSVAKTRSTNNIIGARGSLRTKKMRWGERVMNGVAFVVRSVSRKSVILLQ